jgi:hypothetical protein
LQVDLFDNRNPNLTGDSAERWFYRFVDDTTEWRPIEIPFSSFARRTDFQPGGAPNDGLGLDEASGWALGFPPGEATSYVARVEAYGSSGVVAEGVVTVQFADTLVRVDEGDVGELRSSCRSRAPRRSRCGSSCRATARCPCARSSRSTSWSCSRPV